MKLSSLLHKNEYRTSGDDRDPEISAVCCDRANVSQGCLFVCIRGGRFDTHHMLPEIVRAGAAAAIVEIGSSFCRIPGFPIYEVKDSRAALAVAVSRLCGSPEKSLTVIGITGTNGKTSTSYMLYEILKKAGIRAGLIGTVTYTSDGNGKSTVASRKSGKALAMTTPDPELLYPLLREMADDGVTHVVMEVSSHALRQRRVAPIHFKLGIFTGLSPEHLDFHKTMEEYLEAKALLFRSCDVAVFHIDSPYAEAVMKHSTAAKTVTCSSMGCESADVFAKEISVREPSGISYLYCDTKRQIPIRVPIPGSFTVTNSLLATAAAEALGIPHQAAQRALFEMQGVPGRMERIDTGGEPFDILIDYAHTEAALRSLLCSARSFVHPGGRLLVLFGCGGDRDKGKRAPMGRTAEELADFVYLTSDNSRSEDPKAIIRDILQGMTDRKKRKTVVDRKKAIHTAVRDLNVRDLLLLVGKGHEKYEITKGQTLPFDERKIVMEALTKRRSAHTKRSRGKTP